MESRHAQPSTRANHRGWARVAFLEGIALGGLIYTLQYTYWRVPNPDNQYFIPYLAGDLMIIFIFAVWLCVAVTIWRAAVKDFPTTTDGTKVYNTTHDPHGRLKLADDMLTLMANKGRMTNGITTIYNDLQAIDDGDKPAPAPTPQPPKSTTSPKPQPAPSPTPKPAPDNPLPFFDTKGNTK